MKTLKTILGILFVSFVMLLGFMSCDFYFGKTVASNDTIPKFNYDTLPHRQTIQRPINKQDLINAYEAGYFSGGLREKMGNDLKKTWIEDSTYFVTKFK
jgi:hypothetical protein